MKLHIKILIVLTFMSISTFAQDPNFHIYICFGQSNMEGQGKIDSIDKVVNERFKVFQSIDCDNLDRTKGNWYTATPPLCQCWSGLSPADYFGRTLVEKLPDSITVGIINIAVSGCDIRLFDKNNYQGYTATYPESWYLDKVKAYEGNPYEFMIKTAKLAQKDGTIKGILLHQGETNTGNPLWPTFVRSIYNDMIKDLNLNKDGVPLLAGEVVHKDQGGKCASMNNIINELPKAIPSAHVISSSGCKAKSDKVHFNSEGYRKLGRRYAEKMLELLHRKNK